MPAPDQTTTPTSPQRLGRRRRASGAAVLLAGLLGLGTASATPWAGASGLLTADEEPAGPGRVMLVLDSSGSMAEKASGGQTKISAAKQALRSTIRAMPEDQVVGLRVYGSKVFSASDKGACTDSELVAKPAADNRQALLAAVDRYRPYGETPIGYALQQAGEDLGHEGNRNIILVSDGVPTCEPDPCEVARQLSKKGIDLRIDVVGLDVNSQARDALQCIADAGNGTYYDATDADDLASSLTKVAERTARGYRTTGTPVDGTAQAQGAPEITAGDWVDTLEAGGETFHYTVRREVPGSVLMAGATWRSKGTNVGSATLRLPDGTRCNSQVAVGGAEALSAVAVRAGTDAPDDPCSTAETLDLEVNFGAVAGDRAPVAEIRVTELAPVQNAADLPAPVGEPVPWTPPARSTPQPVTGGTSFVDPEPLTPGSYSGEIVAGETLTFTVEVGWGQSLDAAVSVPKLKPSLADRILRARMGLNVFSPARAAAGASTTQPATENLASVYGPPVQLATTTGPIAWKNFDEFGREGATLAGRQTVVVHLERGASASVPIPFRLDVAVSGEVTGEPVFEAPSTPTDSTSAPSEAPSQEAPDSGAAGAETDDGGSGVLLAGIGAGVLVALLVGVGAFALRRRGRAG